MKKNKKIFFLILVVFSSNLYSTVCKTSKLKTRIEVRQAQKCLKKEIEKSISLAKSYDRYNLKVLDALKYYSDLKLICKKLEIARKYSKYNKEYYLNKLIVKKKELTSAKESLRTLEVQYNYIDKRYSRFKEQIIQLELELELMETDYVNIINGQ